MERVVILGSGLSGLISSYRIKESGYADSIKIYERNPSITRRTSTAAFYCHQLFNNELTPHSFEVQWRVNTKLKTEEEYRDAYAKKVYGEYGAGKVSIKSGEAKGWEINTDKLIEHADIEYNMNCNKIDIDKRVITFNDEHKVSYDTLVITLPMPLFMFIYSSKEKQETKKYIFKCEPIHYSVIKRIPGTYDYNHMILEYHPDPDVPYYRKTYWDDRITIESMVEFDGSVPANPGKMWDCEGITEFRNKMKTKSVHFQGRYARWARKDLTHMVWNRVVKEIYEK
jgi:hypothetical protein|tara:strand:+ start:8003 stop:8854 length:852 start_codon:yes stop_codon:yes gene_type:complete